MLQEIVAKEVLEKLAEDETISQNIPMIKDASNALKMMHGEQSQQSPDRSAKALMIGSSALAGYGVYGLGQDFVFARRHLLDMLMRDKDMPKEFMGGKFADMIAKHKEDYIHYTDRPSPMGEAIGDFKNSWQMRMKLADELGKGGVSRLDALKQMRFMDRGGVLWSAGMIGAGALGWLHALRKQREEQAETEPQR